MNRLVKWITLVMYLTCSIFIMSGTGHAANGTLTGKVTVSGTTTAIAGATITAVGPPEHLREPRIPPGYIPCRCRRPPIR